MYIHTCKCIRVQIFLYVTSPYLYSTGSVPPGTLTDSAGSEVLHCEHRAGLPFSEVQAQLAAWLGRQGAGDPTHSLEIQKAHKVTKGKINTVHS